jgi:hypothetical protein
MPQATPQMQMPPQRGGGGGGGGGGGRGQRPMQEIPQVPIDRGTTAITPTPSPPSDSWGTGAKIGVAIAAFGGLVMLVHAATRNHATVRGSSPREAASFARLPSRSGRY